MSELIEVKAMAPFVLRRCSDFDRDCDDVPDPWKCWLGGGILGLADGYCPLISAPPQQENNDGE